jgi:hypothetical protein
MKWRNCLLRFFCGVAVVTSVFTPELSVAQYLSVEMLTLYCRDQQDWIGRDDLLIFASVAVSEVDTGLCNGDCTSVQTPNIIVGKNESIEVKIGAGETIDLGRRELYIWSGNGKFKGVVTFIEQDFFDQEDTLPPPLELILPKPPGDYEHRFSGEGWPDRYDYTLKYRVGVCNTPRCKAMR